MEQAVSYCDRFQAASIRIGIQIFAYIRGVHNLRQAEETRFIQTILLDDRFKRALAILVTKFDTWGIEGDRVPFFGHFIDLRFRNEEKFSVRIYKASDKPRAGYAVDVHVRAGYPKHMISVQAARVASLPDEENLSLNIK